VPLTTDLQGGGALTGGTLSYRGNPTKGFARSEQLRDRLATFGQKGCTDVVVCFELFNEQLVLNHE
jgi:hypothetical protein